MMFDFSSKNFKALNARGSILVLFALLLPVMLLFFILAVDIGLLYSERTKLQGIADAAALAGATERYQKPSASIPLPSLSTHEGIDERVGASGRAIAGRVWEYLLLNDQRLAKRAEGDTKSNCADVTPGDKAIDDKNKDIKIGADAAFQFTNFTADDNDVASYESPSTTDVIENYAVLLSNYSKDNYDGPQIADIPENIDKIAVQCGVPVDNKDRVRVRLRKIVPTIFIHLFYSGYDNGVPVTVVAAAQSRKPLSTFRLVGLHGVWVNYTSIPDNEGRDVNYQHDPNNLKYIEGDVYCGDNLSVCGESGYVPHTSVSGTITPKKDTTNKIAGYHPNQFTVKGKIFLRNFSTGTPSRPESTYLIRNTNIDDVESRDYELFYKMPAKNGERHSTEAEYLYMRYDDTKKTMRYALESTLDANPTESASQGWYHVYNFNRYTNWERVKVWNDDLGRFMALPPHLMRIGIAPQKDREDFLAATKSALSLRQTYRMNLNALYKEAIRALGPDRKNTSTLWRYLKNSTKNNAAIGKSNCTILPGDKNIKLLVEIDGVPTTQTASYTTNGLAFLLGTNTNDNLNIEQMVVVIKDPHATDADILNSSNNDFNVYHNGAYYNETTTLRTQTGALMIEDVKSGITIGDIYSEANLCLSGDSISRKNIITFNGVVFSEKNVVIPFFAQSHNFTGSCSIFGNRVIMGYRYGNSSTTGSGRNDNCSELTAGLDYPVTVLVKKRHLFSTYLNDYSRKVFTPVSESDVPMHYAILGLKDDEYHAEVFEGEANLDFNDDLEPSKLQLKTYNNNYNYHWFNPNMQMCYYPLDNSKLQNVNIDPKNPSKNKELYKFSEGQYGLQKLSSGYFDIFHKSSYPANQLLNNLSVVKKSITDSVDGFISEEEMFKSGFRNNWHIAPNVIENVSTYRVSPQYEEHIIAIMPLEGGDSNNPNKGTLYHYSIKSDYPYVGGNYLINGSEEPTPLFNSTLGNSMLQFYGPSIKQDNSGRMMNDILFTAVDNSDTPWIRLAKYQAADSDSLTIYSDLLGYSNYVTSDKSAKTKFYPWYFWLPSTVAGGDNKPTADRMNTDYYLSLLDVNRVYLNFWKRAALYGGDSKGISNPFAYYQPDSSPDGQRNKVLKMVHGIADDVPAMGDVKADERAKREGYIYRFTMDIDMMATYRIDDLIRFNCSYPGTVSVSDSGGKRWFDEATGVTGEFGTYPARVYGSYLAHAFGVPDDSIYSSIGLVE